MVHQHHQGLELFTHTHTRPYTHRKSSALRSYIENPMNEIFVVAKEVYKNLTCGRKLIGIINSGNYTYLCYMCTSRTWLQHTHTHRKSGSAQRSEKFHLKPISLFIVYILHGLWNRMCSNAIKALLLCCAISWNSIGKGTYRSLTI